MTTNYPSIYKLGLLAALLFWYFEKIGIFPGLIPVWLFLGINWGFWFILLVTIAALYFLVIYLETILFGQELPTWLLDLRNNQGTSHYVDVLLLMVLFFSAVCALAAHSFSLHLGLVLIFTLLGAIQSLVGDRTLQLPRPRRVGRLPSDAEGKLGWERWQAEMKRSASPPRDSSDDDPTSDPSSEPDASPDSRGTDEDTPLDADPAQAEDDPAIPPAGDHDSS